MDIWLLIISIISGIVALMFFLNKAFSKRKLFGTTIYWSRGIWSLLPSLFVFFCFLVISVYFFDKVKISKSKCDERQNLKYKVDSLSNLLNSLTQQQETAKISYVKKEEELTRALKSKIETAYTVKTLEHRVDTVFVIVRDTSNERKLKEKLMRVQLEKFELATLIDSLRTRIVMLEKKKK